MNERRGKKAITHHHPQADRSSLSLSATATLEDNPLPFFFHYHSFTACWPWCYMTWHFPLVSPGQLSWLRPFSAFCPLSAYLLVGGEWDMKKALRLWKHCSATAKPLACYQHCSTYKSKTQHLYFGQGLPWRKLTPTQPDPVHFRKTKEQGLFSCTTEKCFQV